jgi:hypothetical protein
VLKLHSDKVRHIYGSPNIIMYFKLQLDEPGGKFVMHDKLTQNFSRKIPEGRSVFEKSKCKWQSVQVEQ